MLFLDVVAILDKRHIPHAVIGALAASFHGLVRASLDADAVISVHARHEALDLCEDLRAQGLQVEHHRGDKDDPIAAVINIQDQYKNKVDLLIGIKGVGNEIFSRCVTAKFMKSSIHIVGREDFIALKIFAGNPQDIQDVIGVLQVSGSKIDLMLLRELVSQYGPEYIKKLEKLLKEYQSQK